LHAWHGIYARRLVTADASLQLRRSDGHTVGFRIERVVTYIPAERLLRFIQTNRAQPVLPSEEVRAIQNEFVHILITKNSTQFCHTAVGNSPIHPDLHQFRY